MRKTVIACTIIALASCAVDQPPAPPRPLPELEATKEPPPANARCQTCGTESDEWLDPLSSLAQPYIAQIVAIDPALATGETTCRHNEFVTGCCVVREVSGQKLGVCCALAYGSPVCEVVSGNLYYEWLWTF